MPTESTSSRTSRTRSERNILTMFFFLGISSPQLHASGRLRDFPNGVPVLLKEASVPELKHRRSLSSPNLSPAGQMGALEFSESEESDSSSSTNHSNGKSICSFFFFFAASFVLIFVLICRGSNPIYWNRRKQEETPAYAAAD